MPVRRQAFTVLLAVLLLAPLPRAQESPEEDPPVRRRGVAPAARLDVIPAIRLSGEDSYDNQPAVTVTPGGTTWVAWVRHRAGVGDEVVAMSRRGEEIRRPQALPAPAGQCIRPALAATGEEVWCVWTVSEPAHTSTIWVSRWREEKWSEAARLLPTGSRANQNPEIAAARDGRVAVVYQAHDGEAYQIHLKLWNGEAWGEPRVLSSPGTSNWDPAVVFDSTGELHAVWSGFQDGDYDLYWSRPFSGKAPQRVSARGEYDLHPWLAPSPQGGVWLAWDAVRVVGHGRSGRTTITGANLRGEEAGARGNRRVESAIEVRLLEGDTVRVPGAPRAEIVAPAGYRIAHCGLPKIAVAPRGEPWVIYRALRSEPSAGIGFFWEVQARPFVRGQWGAAVRFAEGDGYLEEAAVATTAGGIVVAHGTEHRAAFIPPRRESRRAGGTLTEDESAESWDHHHDYDARRGWKGEIYLGTIGRPVAAGPAPESLPEASPLRDAEVEPRPRSPGRYQVDVGGVTYHLLWGDTHRHSNVSRCSQGTEPTPDDLYRYGTDICRYDFLALSDHGEDPRQTPVPVLDYYWWKQQKLADLYHVPGAMSVLYNFEWSLRFPHGHHNTLFPGRPTVHLSARLAATSTLAGGWKVLEDAGVRAITIPHTGADPRMGTAWEVQDDRYQRLCEVFQACRGSYEHQGCPREFSKTDNAAGFYWRALEKGYHVGAIASSDHGYGTAYACCYAPENSRQAVWQALWDRRAYGSTTYGLVLDLRSGEHWMGEEWEATEAPVLEVYVRGAAPLASVEILGRSRVLHREGSVAQPLGVGEHRVRWSDPEWDQQTGEQWYYVRVIQTDDEMAWSSPVWVTPGR